MARFSASDRVSWSTVKRLLDADCKTRVVKLSRGFVFLKKRFSYGEGEKVVVRPCRSSVTRQRRKLKKQAALVARGVMTVEQVNQSYQSWRGGMKRLDAHETVRRMDALYKQLFS